jgi:hypothetical protein
MGSFLLVPKILDENVFFSFPSSSMRMTASRSQAPAWECLIALKELNFKTRGKLTSNNLLETANDLKKTSLLVRSLYILVSQPSFSVSPELFYTIMRKKKG